MTVNGLWRWFIAAQQIPRSPCENSQEGQLLTCELLSPFWEGISCLWFLKSAQHVSQNNANFHFSHSHSQIIAGEYGSWWYSHLTLSFHSSKSGLAGLIYILSLIPVSQLLHQDKLIPYFVRKNQTHFLSFWFHLPITVLQGLYYRSREPCFLHLRDSYVSQIISSFIESNYMKDTASQL